MDYLTATRQALRNKAARDYPHAADPRSRFGTIFPHHTPKFGIEFGNGASIFTLGSCFARNIEEALADRDIFLPAATFSVPKTEWGARPNGLLNEFNPGSIAQRILFALNGQAFPDETIVPEADLWADLMLLACPPVPLERAKQRRAEIDGVYRHLAQAQVIIITLGLVEAWFDEETKLYLNRMPPHAFAARNPKRFTYKRMDAFECMPLLQAAVTALEQRGIKVILTVSPVPLSTTFSAVDCTVANEFSKAVLRVCAGRLTAHPLCDYFPSYEIVRSCGMPAYIEDQVHVKDTLVREITGYMVSLYGSR
jgi:hypothetical protein